MTDAAFVPKSLIETKIRGREVKFLFAWFDFWIGIYFDPKNKAWYICPIPCCVFYIGGAL
jgi:hypothetical protein